MCTLTFEYISCQKANNESSTSWEILFLGPCYKLITKRHNGVKHDTIETSRLFSKNFPLLVQTI